MAVKTVLFVNCARIKISHQQTKGTVPICARLVPEKKKYG
jgi:hypothetical protein